MDRKSSIYGTTAFFEEGGAVYTGLKGFEVRPQQLRMVECVEDAIVSGRNLIVESGTGIGKSLAYLVPFIEWAVREGKRCVISTYTKALQNQLFIKDLPFLRSVLGIDFRYALCMGSENYLCLRKACRDHGRDLFDTERRADQCARVAKWAEETETGLVTDMDFVPDRSVWSRFCRESDLCLGRKCRSEEKCFYRRARQRQSEAHILVTNHALLFTNMVSEGRLLPVFHGLVLDEAHMLEDVATGHFGAEAGTAGLRRLADGISAYISRLPAEVSAAASEAKNRLTELGEDLADLRSASERIFGKDDTTVRFDGRRAPETRVSDTLEEVSAAMLKLQRLLDPEESAEEARAYAERCVRAAEALDFIFDAGSGDYVYWAEVRARKGGANYTFRAAPIEVSAQMRAYLFEKVCPVVLTSATLSLSGRNPDFEFIKKRLGLDDPLEALLGSPFDYRKNVLVYTPRHMADPNGDRDLFMRQLQDEITELFDVTGGGMFVLFTSYDMMNAVYEGISEERDDISMLRQGDLPRYVLLDVFKKNSGSMLLGTSTFWQGVDVPGKALECVVITKLPFSVPSDPVNAARIDHMRKMGEDPFNGYQVPQAAIMFKQGFGRLIRTCSDRGVVAVLDPRIRTKRYGKKFLEVLPECEATDNMERVGSFLKGGEEDL